MSHSPHSKIVLYIEDEENDRFLLNFAFKRASPELLLITAKDGEEAIQWLNANAGKSGQLSCVLLDLNLPRKNGYEVLEWLRQQPAFKTLPVVVLTSSLEEQDIIRGYRLGANSYIRKPVDFVQFMEAVRQLGLYWLMLNETPPSPMPAKALTE
jgi:two-component system response regulator